MCEDGCDACQHGSYFVATCPKTYCDAGLWQVLELADLFKRGLPPVSGGVLDQTQWFVDAARFAIGEREHWKGGLTDV